MSNRFKNILLERLDNKSIFSPFFTDNSICNMFNKVSVSRLLQNNENYPVTYIIKNENEFNNTLNKLDNNSYYYIKPKFGERCKNISIYHNNQFVIKKEIRYPFVIQKEVIPRLIDGYKVDYRVYVLYVKINNKIDCYMYPFGLERRCKEKCNNIRNEENSFTISGGDRKIVLLNGKVKECINNVQKNILPRFNTNNEKEIEICFSGYDLIENNKRNFLILEINSKPCFFHRKNIQKLHNDIIEDIIHMVNNKNFKNFIKLKN